VVCVATALVLGVACQGTQRRLGDLNEVRASGELRVIVRPGFLGSSLPRTGRIDEIALLRELALRLGVELKWVRARRHDQMLPWLEEGRGDLVVSRLSPAALERAGFISTTALDWVEDLVVSGPGATTVQAVDELGGRPVHLHRSNAWLLEAASDMEAVRLVPVPEELSLEETLLRVRSGRWGLTVADSGLVETMQAVGGLRVLGPLTERRPVVWGVRGGSHRLRAAVDNFLFAEQVLARTSRTRSCRDLEQVRAAGVLRLVTRNSPTTCSIERGGLEGFEYDLASALCRRLSLRLDLSIPPPGVDPLDWLEDGYGDVAALHEPMDLKRRGSFLATSPYRWVDLVAVSSEHNGAPAAVDDLAGRVVAAPAATASWSEVLPLEPPLLPLELPSGADALTALLEVSRGSADLAVVDADTARLELQHRSGLVLGPVVVPEVPLVWVLNPSAPRLHKVIDAFLTKERRSGLVRQLARSELGSWKPYISPLLPEVPVGSLTPYDELLRWEGRQHGIDWRLLASLMYEESRFDPDAVGPGGSAGLFQFMPFTWQELGVEDPHHPAEAASAGARYLRRLMDSFRQLPMADRVAMAIASYNVGPRHVFDARRLAGEMGLEFNRWSGGVETAMVLLDNPEVARRFPAGVCRCRRAVGYTRRILRRYAACCEQFPPA